MSFFMPRSVRFWIPRITNSRFRLSRRPIVGVIAGLLLAAAMLTAAGPGVARVRCVAGDNGGGTTNFPPYGPFGYQSPTSIELITNGMPPGSMLVGRLSLVDIVDGPSAPGGGLGGMTHQFSGRIRLELRSAGAFPAYSRMIELPISTGEAHTGPVVPFDPAQNIPTDMFMLFGQIIGDPDFDLLRVVSGTNFALPGPGRTRLDRLPSGDWNVDSFFDIEYRIDFVGSPGGPLAGLSGSTTTASRIQEGRPMRDLCAAPDAGGTAAFPSDCGPYRSNPETDLIRNGLPLGAAITGKVHLTNIMVTSDVPGGQYGGDVEGFTADAVIELRGAGTPLLGFSRVIVIPVTCQTITGPRVPGQIVQGFPADMNALQGQIIGDPDFDLLRITGGNAFGMPSPGHTTLTQLAGGSWAVDSFFDITYRIDFVGNPGGTLAGLSGSTNTDSRFEQGGPVNGMPCVVPNIGGTADLPPPCPSGHDGDPTGILCLNGLPPGSPLLATMHLDNVTTVFEAVGGSLGGTVQNFTGIMTVQIEGVGVYSGYSYVVSMPVNGQSEAAHRVPGTTPQSVPMELNQIVGSIIGDPDFDLLRIRTGTVFGLPAPGHTTLTLPSAADWTVDSFFDITYEIDFIGGGGGIFAGMSGTTRGTVRMRAGQIVPTSEVAEVAPFFPGELGPATPNPTIDRSSVSFRLESPGIVRAFIFDVAGRPVRRIVDGLLPAGDQRLTWDGRNEAGAGVAAGLYFYKVEFAGKSRVRRVVMNR